MTRKEMELEIKYLKEKIILLENQISFMEKYLIPTPLKITYPDPYYPPNYTPYYPPSYPAPSYPPGYPTIICGGGDTYNNPTHFPTTATHGGVSN
jgi:hypothetical protein